MLPYVVVHNAVSVDGRMDHFNPDVGFYNFLALIWKPDIMLTGSNTILSWYQNSENKTKGNRLNKTNVDKKDKEEIQEDKVNRRKQTLAVVDSRGRIKYWNKLRETGYWREIIVLCSDSTPEDYIKYLKGIDIRYLKVGSNKVDFHIALKRLYNDFDAKVVRVDSGGTLNGILFRQGLVDEVSTIVYPYLVGGKTSSSMFKAKDLVSANGIINLKLLDTRKVRGDLIWNRYKVEKLV